MKGIIFDFNGTLFQDSCMQELSWEKFAKDYADREITKDEFAKYIHGRSNHQTVEFLLNAQFSEDYANNLGEIKEKIYRQLCIDSPSAFHLTEGAEEFLNYLKERKFSFTIATSVGKENLDFYFESFNLSKWFDYSDIIYSDGTLLNKPNPAPFIKACRVLSKEPEDCIVFEDSTSGIESAINANIGYIVAITTGDNRNQLERLKVNTVIDNFHDEVIYSIVK